VRECHVRGHCLDLSADVDLDHPGLDGFVTDLGCHEDSCQHQKQDHLECQL